MSFRVRFAFALTLIGLAVLSSCGEYENLEIDKEARRLSDSIYRAQRDSLSRQFDAQCGEMRDSLFSIYFDSLKLVEAQKIKQLIQR